MLLGIDEVGRGPIAGPLLVGAVAFDNPTAEIWQDVKDSKKLSRKKREALAEAIKSNSATGIGWVSAAEIDQLGIIGALKLATGRAVEEVAKQTKITEIIIDGNINFLKDTKYESITTTLIKGDDKIKQISAASIIAKVAHDEYMYQLDEKYPEYGFKDHVGYGTKKHMDALKTYGPIEEHRFMMKPAKEAAMNIPELAQKFATRLNPQTKSTRQASTSQVKSARQIAGHQARKNGQAAEELVAEFLKSKGQKILSRNYKTKYYEIDIVSADKDHIYFTEVKSRQGNIDPREAITNDKLHKMTIAAESYIKILAKKLNKTPEELPSPILAVATAKNGKLDWFPLTSSR